MDMDKASKFVNNHTSSFFHKDHAAHLGSYMKYDDLEYYAPCNAEIDYKTTGEGVPTLPAFLEIELLYGNRFDPAPKRNYHRAPGFVRHNAPKPPSCNQAYQRYHCKRSGVAERQTVRWGIKLSLAAYLEQ